MSQSRAAGAAGWEARIQAQLEQREARVAAVAKVIQSYARRAGKVGEFASQSREAEARTREMQGEHERLLDSYERGSGGGGGGRGMSLAQQRIADLERDVEALKEERTEMYRRQGTNAQRLLDLSDQVREKDERLRQQELEIMDAHEALRRAGTKADDMRAQLKEKDEAIQILQDELSALQLEIVHIEARGQKLQAENEDLVRRWLAKMNEEADKVNAVTEELEQIKRKSAALSPRMGLAVFEDDQFFGAPAGTPTPTTAGGVSAARGGSLAPRSAVGKIDGRMEEIHSIALSSSGALLAVGGQTTTVRVFDAETGEGVFALAGCLKGVNHVEFSADGTLLLAASSDHTARIWKLDTGRHWKSLTGHIGSVMTAKFSRDASRVYTYSQDRTIKVWDTQRGLCIKTLFTVSSCHDFDLLDSMGAQLVTAHMDNAVRVWDTATGKRVREAALHKEQVMSVWASPTGERILTNSYDGTLKLVDARTLDVVTVMSAPGYRPSRNWARASLSPDERYAMAGSIDGKLFVWDANSGDLVRTLDIHRSAVCDSLWHPSGMRVYSAEKSRYILMLH
ncbi:hypothetical protein H4R18_005614 [Coemansia javaensis]|uniref:Autophagy-related protein 16 domain-containing protein n=1 Tax=Coemansia javaensis TaxID=2761396 RepID=A0A9W8LEJ9_9FUNG|nr:hypothetical protein H4R18_005614 [Coemansia javaensis]